jgi:hypothetical protein
MLDTLLAVDWMAMLIASQQTLSWIGIWREVILFVSVMKRCLVLTINVISLLRQIAVFDSTFL